MVLSCPYGTVSSVRLMQWAASLLCFTLAAVSAVHLVRDELVANVVAPAAVAASRDALRTEWSSPTKPVPTSSQTPSGESVALISIPSLRDKVWEYPVRVGSSSATLAAAVAMFPGSPKLGTAGNTALVGHRTSHGRPFSDFHRLRVNDVVIFETRDAWLVYRLFRDRVVKESETWMLSDAPIAMGGRTHVVSLITCTPKGATSHRWVWQGSLWKSFPKSAAMNPDEVLANLAT